MEAFKNYLNTLSIEDKDKILKELSDQMSINQKIKIFNESQDTLKIDYIIYGVKYEHRLMNEESLNIIHNEMVHEENFDNFSILCMFDWERQYFICDKMYEDNQLIQHPDAQLVYQAIRTQLPHIQDGIVVEHHLDDIGSIHDLTVAVMDCEHCAYLTTFPYEMKYYKIKINNQIKTVLHMKFDTESG